MSDRKSTSFKKIAAGIMAAVMLFFVLFSIVFIIKEAAHDCHGEHCEICECIEQCEAVLSHAGFGTVRTAGQAVLFVLLITTAIRTIRTTPATTPVSSKVQLNN